MARLQLEPPAIFFAEPQHDHVAVWKNIWNSRLFLKPEFPVYFKGFVIVGRDQSKYGIAPQLIESVVKRHPDQVTRGPIWM